jgi:hypothetical protein
VDVGYCSLGVGRIPQQMAETCRGNLMRTIKKIALSICWLSFTGLGKKLGTTVKTRMIHNFQSNTAKFFIINVNQKGNVFRRFSDRHHQAF